MEPFKRRIVANISRILPLLRDFDARIGVSPPSQDVTHQGYI